MLDTFLDIKSRVIWLSSFAICNNSRRREDLLMKLTKNSKLIFCFLILHSSFLITNCFSQWSQIAQINTNQLNAVKFFNESIGIAVGQGGIWRSTNSGFNWTQIITTGRFNAVSFSDFNNGTAVGDNGLIMRTTDNGLSWFQEFSPTTNNLYCIACPSVSNRFALGQNGVFIRFFINTWSLISTFGYDIYDIKMLNINSGYIVGSQNNEIVRSTGNGGTNWFTALNSSGRLNSIYCVSSSTIAAVGSNSRIRISTDYGINWVVPVVVPNHNFTCITFASNDTAFVAGDNGIVFRSTNGGYNWLIQNSGTSSSLKSIFFINGKTGWAVGNNGIVLRTLTGGIVGANESEISVPKEYTLYQNYPNPFNPTTFINFEIKKDAFTELNFYDVNGKLIQSLVKKYLVTGIYTVTVTNLDISSGTYFYSLNIYSKNNTIIYRDTKSMVLIK